GIGRARLRRNFVEKIAPAGQARKTRFRLSIPKRHLQQNGFVNLSSSLNVTGHLFAVIPPAATTGTARGGAGMPTGGAGARLATGGVAPSRTAARASPSACSIHSSGRLNRASASRPRLPAFDRRKPAAAPSPV